MDGQRLIDEEKPAVDYKKRFRICLVVLSLVVLAAIATFVIFIVRLHVRLRSSSMISTARSPASQT